MGTVFIRACQASICQQSMKYTSNSILIWTAHCKRASTFLNMKNGQWLFSVLFLRGLHIWATWAYMVRLKKNYVSKLTPAFVFRCAFDTAKFKILFFFFAWKFFPLFYEISCKNIHENIWNTQKDTLDNRLLQLCALSCILFIQKSSSHISYWTKVVTNSNLARLLRGKKKQTNKQTNNNKKKKHLGQVFQSVTSSQALRHRIFF